MNDRMSNTREGDVSRRPIQEEYRYLKLQDAAISIGQNVNIYGKIVEYDQPRQTRGSDIMCTMTLRDMSYPLGLRVLVFAPSLDLIPGVKAVGDIIRFHRVKVTAHNKVPQVLARIQRASQFLLFHGKNDRSNVPYQQSSKNYTIDPCDGQILNLFRDWHQNLPAEPATSKQYRVPIKGLKPNSYFDLCCQLLHIDAGGEDHGFAIHVWDGTDAPPAPIETSLEAGDLPEPQNLAPVPPRAVFCGFPPLGTVLLLIPDTPDQKLPLSLPAVACWALLRNLKCRVYKGVYEGIWTRESKLMYTLPADSPSVVECLRAYKDRDRTPQSCPHPLESITVTDFEHVRFSTIREVLVYPEVTHKFRCLVRVVSTWPSDLKDFCGTLDDDCSMSESSPAVSKETHYVYALRLTLEDPTGRIDVYLYGDDAVQFFNGHPAKDLHSQGATVGALERKVKRLLGVADGLPPGLVDPPWIKCCLKSYYLDKERPWESRRYRLFGTAMPG